MAKVPLSRRSFLLGGAMAGAAAAAGLAGCAPQSATQVAATGSEAPAAGGAATTASDWLGVEPAIAEDEIARTVECDILVVGAGTGGLFAACAAAEEGAKVVVLEKFTQGGGIRDDLGAVNSRLQQESNYTIDRLEMARDMYHYAAGQLKPELFDVWYANSAEAIDWYEERLAERDVKLWHEAAEELHETNYKHWATGHSPAWPADGSLDGNTVLCGYAAQLGTVEFLYETPMVKLDREGEKVVGAIAQASDGTYVRVAAAKGTIVCTGGYARNEEMMNALQPHTQSIQSGNTAIPGTEGDGIKACLWAGAKMDETHSSMLFDRAALLPTETAGYETQGEMFWMGSQPWLKVNLNGERFCNESGTYDFILHADASQPGNTHVTLWDADYQTYAEQFDMHGCSRMFPFDNGAAPNIPMEAIVGMNQGLIEKGYIQQADTIEELAEKLGLPADALVATVARNNENYDAQVDPDFGKEPFRLSPVRKAPFYGVRNTGRLLCTMDGICIDDQCRALTAAGAPIEGLYVVGNDSGCYYSMTYPNLSTGNAAGRTVTFARRTAKALASA
ncbi:MAG: FAD-dependent oxidoreductase [Adlercreutzia caecimuris]|nr:FAD-dependent oxidoreductase [Adlercreutzia caecimuris]